MKLEDAIRSMVLLPWIMLFSNQVRAQESVCARVTIQIEQRVVLTRTAFRATLKVNNEAGDPLENVLVSLDVRDADGESANQHFANVDSPTVIPDSFQVDGTGLLPVNVEGIAEWLIIPEESATSGPEPVSYTIGGTFSYLQGGVPTTVTLFPSPIDVYPDAKLFLNYYLQSPVYSDNPFTSTVVEPAEPFSLGLLIRNTGFGAARQLRIMSSQPQIILNESQLLIAFQIIGSQLGLSPVMNSLNVNFGDLAPNSSAVARWLMTSTLQGEFICYNATFEHVTGMGNPALSLIESVKIHELNHVVLMESPPETEPAVDQLPDFLVNNRTGGLGPGAVCQADQGGGCPSGTPDDDIPDCIHSSDGSIRFLENIIYADDNTSIFDQVPPSLEDLTVRLTVVAEDPGWTYIRVHDPSWPNNLQLSGYKLAKVERGDGRILRLDYNAWTTHRWVPATEPPNGTLEREDRLHLFDYMELPGTVTYFVTYLPALEVASVVVNGGLEQRSNVEKLAINFTGPTNIMDLITNQSITAAVRLYKRNGERGEQVFLSADRFAWNEGSNRLTIDLTTDVGGANRETILGEGNYRLEIPTRPQALIHSPSQVGDLVDSDGRPGSDNLFRYGTLPEHGLFRFPGDGNGDRAVNQADLDLVEAAWLQQVGGELYNANADMNLDGVVNFLDLQLVREQWNETLGF